MTTQTQLITRRSALQGLLWVAAAPAIVRASSLMPIKALEPIERLQQFIVTDVNVEQGIVFWPPFNVHKLEQNIAAAKSYFELSRMDLRIGDKFTILGITTKS